MTTCSQNEIGIKAPSKATVVTERRSRMQAFSNSFNNIKYRDQVRGVRVLGVLELVGRWCF